MPYQVIPKPIVWTIGDVLGTWYYSHTKLNTLFGQLGAPGDPPPGNCVQKCQTWLFRVNDEHESPLQFLGDLLSVFISMNRTDDPAWVSGRDRITKALEGCGLECGTDGRIVERSVMTSEVSSEKPAEAARPTVNRECPAFKDLHFRVALSFPGEKRAYVEKVANELRARLPPDAVFYDRWYQHELARPNLDVLLQDVYRNRADLIVVFLCHDYRQKDWCEVDPVFRRGLMEIKLCCSQAGKDVG